MGTLNLSIPITPENALLWFSTMIICSSLAIMTSAFIFQHDKSKQKTKKLLSYLTSSAYLFFISGILVVITSFIQIPSGSNLDSFFTETATPILLFLAGLCFIIATGQIFVGLDTLSNIYEIKEEENPALLNRLWYKFKNRFFRKERIKEIKTPRQSLSMVKYDEKSIANEITYLTIILAFLTVMINIELFKSFSGQLEFVKNPNLKDMLFTLLFASLVFKSVGYVYRYLRRMSKEDMFYTTFNELSNLLLTIFVAIWGTIFTIDIIVTSFISYATYLWFIIAAILIGLAIIVRVKKIDNRKRSEKKSRKYLFIVILLGILAYILIILELYNKI